MKLSDGFTLNIEIDILLYNDSIKINVIIQICHASVGILMECLPGGGWFSRGRSPSENDSPEGRHSIRIPTLAWHMFYYTEQTPIW